MNSIDEGNNKKFKKANVQIRFEILELLYYNIPQLRTYVWRKATSLSYDCFLKHLDHLKDRGLIIESDEGLCGLTEKGREVVDQLRNFLPSLI